MQLETSTNWQIKRTIQSRVPVARSNRRSTPFTHSSLFDEVNKDALNIQTMEVRETQMQECGLCCEMIPLDLFRLLTNCKHSYCKICIKKYLRLSIHESLIEIPCPGCSADIHPNDVKRYCHKNPDLIAKYEAFSLRAALIKIPEARWCPAPDCGFAFIFPDGHKCPKIKCQRPECATEFCFKCKKPWHEGMTCTDKKIRKTPSSEASLCRPCPKCQTMIMKENDGSCNHMHCTMCQAEFCWLCLKEINDLHYMSPTGCTFWGKKPWSGKKRLMWQIGSLIGSPVVIAATAVISVPLIVGFVPFSVGKKVYKKMKNQSKAKRVISTAVAVTGSAIVSPAIAGVAIAIGVPFALGYTYIMVPKALMHDIVDYVQKRKRRDNNDPSAPVIFDGYAGALMSLAPPPEEENPLFHNDDPRFPGPSSTTPSECS